jgi:hypothetical protein
VERFGQGGDGGAGVVAQQGDELTVDVVHRKNSAGTAISVVEMPEVGGILISYVAELSSLLAFL